MVQAHSEPTPKKNDERPLVMPLTEPAKGDEKPKPTIGVRGEAIEDGARDPDTIAEEQRKRSDEYLTNLGKDNKTEPERKQPLPPPPPSKK